MESQVGREDNIAPNIPALQESIANNNILIHYEPNRKEFTVSDSELELLEKIGNSYWKDIFLFCCGLGIPSLINLITQSIKTEVITPEILINSMVIFGAFAVGIISFFAWKKDDKRFKTTIEKIKNKPLHRIPVDGKNK